MDISIGVIAFSIVIGVITNLITPYIGDILGRISGVIRKRNEEKRIVFENTVEYVLGNSNEEIILRLRYSQRSIASLIAIFSGIIIMTSSNQWELFIGFIIYMFGIFGSNRAEKLGRILHAVRKRKKSETKEIDLE